MLLRCKTSGSNLRRHHAKKWLSFRSASTPLAGSQAFERRADVRHASGNGYAGFVFSARCGAKNAHALWRGSASAASCTGRRCSWRAAWLGRHAAAAERNGKPDAVGLLVRVCWDGQARRARQGARQTAGAQSFLQPIQVFGQGGEGEQGDSHVKLHERGWTQAGLQEARCGPPGSAKSMGCVQVTGVQPHRLPDARHLRGAGKIGAT